MEAHVFGGRHPEEAAEGGVEVAQGLEPGLEGDLGHAGLRGAEEGLAWEMRRARR